jgi:hypothetical protein
LRSGLEAAEMLGVRRPWAARDVAEIPPLRAAAE